MLKALFLFSAAMLPAAAVAQGAPGASQPATQASPAPQASTDASGPDASALTPQQQAALQQAIITTSQNPVGNIAIIPFQNNFNYGVGPYTRYQYNLNVQPVVPFMLSKNMNLIARTIIPVISNPSFAPPQVCESRGCPWTSGIGDTQEQLFFHRKPSPAL